MASMVDLLMGWALKYVGFTAIATMDWFFARGYTICGVNGREIEELVIDGSSMTRKLSFGVMPPSPTAPLALGEEGTFGLDNSGRYPEVSMGGAGDCGLVAVEGRVSASAYWPMVCGNTTGSIAFGCSTGSFAVSL